MSSNKIKEKSGSEALSLEQIRTSLNKVEAERSKKGISEEQRVILEQASITLRKSERAYIDKSQKNLIDNFEKETGSVNTQAKEIRALVKKMNKLPKTLDVTETVIKECVKVLQAIAKYLLVSISVLLIISCSTLSKSQIKRVNELCVCSDSVSVAPSIIFKNLSDIRRERGLIYVASLHDTESRITELNDLAKAEKNDETIIKKADVYMKVLNSYLRALRSLSSDNRWKQSGIELRGIGRNVDSLLIAYNKLEWDDEVKIGLPRQIGKTSGYLSEQYFKRRQKYLLKKYIETGDTIVSTCCDALIKLLKKDELSVLIENEEIGLENNYRSYLNNALLDSRYPDIDLDRKFLELKSDLNSTRALQKKCVTALQSLKKAHHNLLDKMDKAHTYAEYSDEIFELSDQVAGIKQLINEY